MCVSKAVCVTWDCVYNIPEMCLLLSIWIMRGLWDRLEISKLKSISLNMNFQIWFPIG